jgi:hypothetical protein
MKSWQLSVAVLAGAFVASTTLTSQAIGQSSGKLNQPTVSFADDVVPIFKGRCYECHRPGGAGYEKSGLDLTTYEGVMKGTKFGKMIVPGDPDTSNLVWLLEWRASPELRMPHGKKQLSICDRTTIRRWILEGARNN